MRGVAVALLLLQALPAAGGETVALESCMKKTRWEDVFLRDFPKFDDRADASHLLDLFRVATLCKHDFAVCWAVETPGHRWNCDLLHNGRLMEAGVRRQIDFVSCRILYPEARSRRELEDLCGSALMDAYRTEDFTAYCRFVHESIGVDPKECRTWFRYVEGPSACAQFSGVSEPLTRDYCLSMAAIYEGVRHGSAQGCRGHETCRAYFKDPKACAAAQARAVRGYCELHPKIASPGNSVPARSLPRGLLKAGADIDMLQP